MAKQEKVSYPNLMKCARVFLCGSTVGPPVKEQLEQLGHAEAKIRLEIGLEKLFT